MSEGGGGLTLTPAPGGDDRSPIPLYGEPGFYGSDLSEPKERALWVREVVSQVRRCQEMRRYREYLGDSVNMNRCAVMSNLSPEQAREARLEMHHHPLTLHDIVEMTLGAMEREGARLTTMAVAHRVMAMHWRGVVGIVPLLESVHELAHEGKLSIDPRMIYGDWPRMVEELSGGMTQAIAARLAAEFATWDGRQRERNARLLEVLPTAWTSLPPTPRQLLLGREPEEEADVDGSL
jgi:hypothetical protein